MELRLLQNNELDAVSGGAPDIIISKTLIITDKGTLSLGYIVGVDGVAIPNTTWTPAGK